MTFSLFSIFLYLILAVIIFSFFFLSIKVWISSSKDLIEIGRLDDEIKKSKKKKEHKALKYIGNTLSGIFIGGLIGISALLLVVTTYKPTIDYIGSVPVSILSGSMSEKNELNDYLFDETLDLNNQFNQGDIIFLDKKTGVEDLKQYDVVGYFNNNDQLVIHRIIDFGYYTDENVFHYVDNIEDATHFILRGDNNTSSDNIYITYDDIYGIYHGNKIPYLGWAVQYVQSGFGLISLCAVGGIIFAYEYYIDKYNKAYKKRQEELEKSEPLLIENSYPVEEEKEESKLNVEQTEEIKEEAESEVENEISDEEFDSFTDLEKSFIEEDEEDDEAINFDDFFTQEEDEEVITENKVEEKKKDLSIDKELIKEEKEGNGILLNDVKEDEKEERRKVDKNEYLRNERNERAVRKTARRLNR